MAKKPHPTARRRPGGSDDPDDAFIARLLQVWGWAKRNTQVLTFSVVVLVVGLAAGIYYYNYRQDLQLQASEEYEALQQTVFTADPEAARGAIQRYLDRFSDTPYGTEARLLLARTQLEAGEPGAAIDALEPAARDLSDPLGVDAAFLLATAYEESGRHEEAVETYLEVAEEARMAFQVRDALGHAARIRADQGELAEAVRLYERLLATYEEEAEEDQGAETPERAFYRLRLSELRAAMEEG